MVLRLRRQHLRPHLEAFFAWAEVEYERVRSVRGVVRSALGYVVRQKQALMRILDYGRLVLENNRSERELRKIAMMGSLCVTPSSTRKPKRSSVCRIATWATLSAGACT